MGRLMAVAAAIALVAATEAAAEDWHPADLDAEMLAGVDVTSIEADRQLRGAMVMFAFATTSPEGADYMIILTGFDCDARTAAAITTSLYSADGTLLASGGDPESAVNSPIAPGSLTESVEQIVCGDHRNPAGFSDGVEFAAAARRLLLEGGVP